MLNDRHGIQRRLSILFVGLHIMLFEMGNVFGMSEVLLFGVYIAVSELERMTSSQNLLSSWYLHWVLAIESEEKD